jgi:hypothetical protein
VIYTIHYVDPRNPALAGLTLAFDAAQIPALKARLEHDGYVVIKVTPKTPIAGSSIWAIEPLIERHALDELFGYSITMQLLFGRAR